MAARLSQHRPESPSGAEVPSIKPMMCGWPISSRNASASRLIAERRPPTAGASLFLVLSSVFTKTWIMTAGHPDAHAPTPARPWTLPYATAEGGEPPKPHCRSCLRPAAARARSPSAAPAARSPPWSRPSLFLLFRVVRFLKEQRSAVGPQQEEDGCTWSLARLPSSSLAATSSSGWAAPRALPFVLFCGRQIRRGRRGNVAPLHGVTQPNRQR